MGKNVGVGACQRLAIFAQITTIGILVNYNSNFMEYCCDND